MKPWLATGAISLRITKAELVYGVEVSPRRAQDAAALAAFQPSVDAVALDEDAARHYAEIRADLKRRGEMIGANGLVIAAIFACDPPSNCRESTQSPASSASKGNVTSDRERAFCEPRNGPSPSINPDWSGSRFCTVQT